MILNFNNWSINTKSAIIDLINKPTDAWIGGSIGVLTQKKYIRKMKNSQRIISESIKINKENKLFIGAFLAEMAQNDFDKEMRLNKGFKPMMLDILKDQEIVYYAEKWINHELNVFNYFDEDYWSKVKEHLSNLSKGCLDVNE